MVVILEYRVPLPVSVEEYQVGQLYCTTKASLAATAEGQADGDGSGVEVLVNEPYENEESKGQYTKKIYHLGSKMPGWLNRILPESAKILEEDSWNGYPHCKTVLSSPYMGDKMTFVVETRHLADRGESENVHKLDKATLKKRKVINVDIAFDPVDPKDYKESEDPQLVGSKKTGRGPLTDENWIETSKPIMCAYKLVTFEFKWWGLQGTAESFIEPTQKKIFTNFHRQLFCWLDEWYGMDMQGVRDYEDRENRKLAGDPLSSPLDGEEFPAEPAAAAANTGKGKGKASVDDVEPAVAAASANEGAARSRSNSKEGSVSEKTKEKSKSKDKNKSKSKEKSKERSASREEVGMMSVVSAGVEKSAAPAKTEATRAPLDTAPVAASNGNGHPQAGTPLEDMPGGRIGLDSPAPRSSRGKKSREEKVASPTQATRKGKSKSKSKDKDKTLSINDGGSRIRSGSESSSEHTADFLTAPETKGLVLLSSDSSESWSS